MLLQSSVLNRRVRHSVIAAAKEAHLKELVNIYARPVDHGYIERPPVLKKGEVCKVIVDCKIVIECCVVFW